MSIDFHRTPIAENLVLTNDSGLLPVTLDHNVTITGIGERSWRFLYLQISHVCNVDG